MKISKTEIFGAYVIEFTLIEDERGFFARSFCIEEFLKYKMETEIKQCNISYNHKKGTFRGMHIQCEPYLEAKYVRCTKGRIYDIILDLRSNSATYLKWVGIELSSSNYRMVYMPKGVAHGFITLEDHTEVYYQMSEFFHSTSATGYRWDDPAFKIKLPIPIEVISQKDSSYKYISEIIL